MKMRLKNTGRNNNTAPNLGETILSKIRQPHRFNSTLNHTFRSKTLLAMTSDQIREEWQHQIEAEEKKSQARVYAGLSYLR